MGLGLGRGARRGLVSVRRVHLCDDWQRTMLGGSLCGWTLVERCMQRCVVQDSIFKVWDIREPRICIRSHRIRSTWGLSLQWMDQTSLQISGDQGMIFMYDIMVRVCVLLR